jgi:hypothetical protein
MMEHLLQMAELLMKPIRTLIRMVLLPPFSDADGSDTVIVCCGPKLATRWHSSRWHNLTDSF